MEKEKTEYEKGWDYGYVEGQLAQKRKDASLLLPETVEITIRVRGNDDQYEAIRRVLTFELLKQSGGLVFRREMELLTAKVATETAVRDLIERS